MTETLVLATHNRGKLEELRALLIGLPLRVVSVDEVVRTPPHVIEDGRTFAEMSSSEKHAISHRGKAFRALAAGLSSV